MHTSPDYSAAYVILHTDAGEGLSGHGLTFTCGRGNEVCVAGIRALEPLVVGRSLEGITGDLRAFWRSLVSDGQLRWIGPEKGAMHMAVGAVVNAVWDLWAKSGACRSGASSCDLGPEELVGRDRFPVHRRRPRVRRRRSISSRDGLPAREERELELLEAGYPAYTTSAGWLGYDDEKVAALVREAIADGFRHVKMKVGGTSRRIPAGPR